MLHPNPVKVHHSVKMCIRDSDFADMPPYTGIKFRPKNGEMNDYTIGAAVDYPLMRIEEMYLIEAEAIGMSQGLAAGISKLEDFVNTFRYNTSVAVSYTHLADMPIVQILFICHVS